MDIDIESLRSSNSDDKGTGAAESQGSESMKTFDEIYLNAVTEMELGDLKEEEWTIDLRVPRDCSNIFQQERSDDEPHKPDPPERFPSQLPETENSHHEVVAQKVIQFKNSLVPVQVYESSPPQVVLPSNQATDANRSYSSTTPSDLEVPERVESPRVQDSTGFGSHSLDSAGIMNQRGFDRYPSEEHEDLCCCHGNRSLWKILLAVAACVLIAVAIIVPVVLFAIPSKSDTDPVVGSAEKTATDGLNPDPEASDDSEIEQKENLPQYPGPEDDTSQNTDQIDPAENTNQTAPIDLMHNFTDQLGLSRETLFVQILESQVLQRNATFEDMDGDDPRYLALDWMLNHDEMNLYADDARLNQRYVMALLAFALDYQAWEPIGEFAGSISDGVNWLSSSDVCSWHNVTCEDDVIKELDLDYYSLIGNIPAEINQLITLEHMSFMGNCLYGSIPPEIGQLTSLKYLDLSNNALGGKIPQKIFNLNALENLYLESQKGNNWTCTRSNGEVVDVYFSQGDPENGANMGLEGKILNDNIANFSNLKNVMIHSNIFSGTISSKISSLKLLEYLDAKENLFWSTIPDAITSLENIYHLNLAQNYLHGNLPLNMSGLKSLEVFDLGGNAGLNGSLPSSLFELSQLQQLDLHGNMFSGTISDEIGQLSALTLLSLFNNRFSGTLPSTLGLCVDLEYLYIHNTNIGGTVPDEVCSLTEKSLSYTEDYWAFSSDCLHDNVSTLPFIKCECCDVCCDHVSYQCVQLDTSILSRTNSIKEKLEGQVLQRNATFSGMDNDDPRYLALDWLLNTDEMNLGADANNLNQRYILALLAFSLDSQAWGANGNTPSSEGIAGSTYISWLSSTDECLWYNVSCSGGEVVGLDLNEYSLIGKIPAEIGGLVSLDSISFRGNCLYGTIPPELGNLSGLRFLGLAQNSLSGVIPDSLFSLDLLEYLYLPYQFGNDWICLRSDGGIVNVQYSQGDVLNGVNMGLRGMILGDNVAAMKNLRTLSISYNEFSGSISPQISNLVRLENLYARLNSFELSIPDEITELTNIVNLDLALNSFSGKIPEAVGNLDKLELLSLFGNGSLNGTLPISLYNLTNLTYLYIDGNNFSGNISDKIGQLTRLKHLTVYDNPLTGSLPSNLGFCEELEMLHIDNTNLIGTVPDEICMLTKINLDSVNDEEKIFKADCAHDSETGVPFITCSCCDTCCDHITHVCFANYSYSDFAPNTTTRPSQNITSNATESPIVNRTDDSRVSLFMRKFEDEVLQRDATFDDLGSDDPRNLALDWILNDDQMNLGLDSMNLNQRYVLALIAFSLDSKAWGAIEEGSVIGNSDVDGKSTWLSSIDECSWYNVSCTGGLVTGIQLDEYSLIGEIPAEISRLDQVDSISLRKNCLYGTLPPELGELPLKYLGLAENGFSGFIPETLFNLTSVEYVFLSFQNGNRWKCTRSRGGIVDIYYSHGDQTEGANLGLQGKILGDKISNLSSLRTISITKNQFSGTISPDISSLTQLENVYAGSNAIRSSIPTEIALMENIRVLDLSQNYLTGEIPQDVGNLKRLEYFALSGNGGLSGPLPSSLFELKSLQYIYVQENSLTGKIPSSIGMYQDLVGLNLGSNDFTGSLPNGLYNLTNLMFLYLHENSFGGSISDKIGQLTALIQLSLYGNLFTGTVPSSLGLCEELENLYLHETNLHGTVPEEVCALTMESLVPQEYNALSADCYPDIETLIPFITCGCCDVCCDHVTLECVTAVME